ncbi:uncharacterized protein LOC143443642 isoform X2 [Arvicanthis niloticus]|uniref:uncharacterized protein LOC143443642 isoform X2 n=1 Tax=Arvicanthis niloticus TaxID=61156 RepID=UPI00403C8557
MFLLTPENFPLECALERRRRRRQLWRGGKGERALFHLPGGGARIGADPEGAGRRGSHPAAGSRLRAGRSPHPRSRRIRLFSDKERELRTESRALHLLVSSADPEAAPQACMFQKSLPEVPR